MDNFIYNVTLELPGMQTFLCEVAKRAILEAKSKKEVDKDPIFRELCCYHTHRGGKDGKDKCSERLGMYSFGWYWFG